MLDIVEVWQNVLKMQVVATTPGDLQPRLVVTSVSFCDFDFDFWVLGFLWRWIRQKRERATYESRLIEYTTKGKAADLTRIIFSALGPSQSQGSNSVAH